MPLPPNGILSLHGHVGHAVPEQSKPKRAMIVRMSAETFEALEAQPNPPKVEVEFGDSPGIYVGDTFFPMRPQQEKAPHELYIRALSASKPNPTAPLKFYANVAGKFMIERKLGERVESVVRDKTAAAEKQRTERKTIMLDAPPPPAAVAKHPKKKVAAPKKLSVVDTHARTLSASSSAQPSRMMSPRPPALPVREAQHARVSPRPPPIHVPKDETLRDRLIHFLALSPRSTDDVMKMVGGGLEGSHRKDLSDLLKEVAHPAVKQGSQTSGGPAPMRWLLNQKTWLEVRPFAFPDLSSLERKKLAKKAQAAYEAMKIPETDRRWAHIRPKDSSGAENGRPARESGRTDGNIASSSGQSEARKAAATQDVKFSKVKASEGGSRARDLEMLSAKDEGRPSKAEVNKRDAESGTSAAASMRPPIRRLPGSGFKIKSGSNTPPTPGLTSSSGESHKKQPSSDIRASAKQDLHGASSSNQPRHATSLPPPPPRERRPSISSNTSTARVPQTSREVNGSLRATDVAKERGRDSPAPPVGHKRKQALRDEQESEISERETNGVPKRRKVDESMPEKRKERDLTLPKKPIMDEPSPPPARSKQSKYDASMPRRSPLPSMRSPVPPPSPLPPVSSPLVPPRRAQHNRVPSVSSQQSRDDQVPHRTGSTKLRRRSPVYTSSEDENESRRKPDTKHREERHEVKKPSRVPLTVSVLPEDPQGLKRVYARRYPIYESLHKRHVALVEEIRDLLKNGEDDVFLPDGDPGLPSHEQLATLRDELQTMTAELNAIVDKYERLRRQGRTSDGPLARPAE